MGQYYHVIARDAKTGTDKVYDLQTTALKRGKDGFPVNYDNYTGLKLMEHSYWPNDFCRSFAATLVDHPQKVCWCGDYAEEEECKELGFDYNDIWGDNAKASPVELSDFTLDSVKYLVNNDKKCYVVLADYKEKSTEDGWTTFPISLLTALGNGRGGGDYRKENSLVGSWAFDEIYLTDSLPEGFVKEDIFIPMD